MGGRVELGRKFGQLGSGKKSSKIKAVHGTEDVFPIALKTALVATKLGSE
jgi:hypothetical protein